MGSNDGGLLAKMFQRSVVVAVALVSLAFLGGFGVSYALWGKQASPLNAPALAQCGQNVNVGEWCPGQYTTLSGRVSMTNGTPYVILLLGYFIGTGITTFAPLPTQTAGIFYENGQYGYFGLYVPLYETAHGINLFFANNTELPPGAHLNIEYHVSIRYLSGSTNQTCIPQPSVFRPALTEWNHQDFSC